MGLGATLVLDGDGAGLEAVGRSVGSGVRDAVESPESQPTSANIAATTQTTAFTIGHRTVPGAGDWAGTRPNTAASAIRLQV